MVKGKPTKKKPVKASSRVASNAKAPKKSVVSSGGRKKKSLLEALTFKKWLMIGLVIVAVFGGIGAWKLVTSNASAALNYEQCYNRGRTFSSDDGTYYANSTGYCAWQCRSGAGSLVTANVDYAYCTYANSTSISSSYCVNTLHRNYNYGSNGCARRWGGSVGDRVAKGAQCYDNTWTYVLALPYDYCVKPSTTTSTSSTGWVWPVPSAPAPIGSIGYGEYVSGRGYHKGIDLGRYDGSTLGDKVVAAHSGTVKQSYWDGTCGGMMVISASGTSYYQGYQHLQSRYVSVGDTVSAGQAIGTVGSYGETTCGGSSSNAFYHLHFSIEKGNWLSYYSSPLSNSINPCSVLAGC